MIVIFFVCMLLCAVNDKSYFIEIMDISTTHEFLKIHI